LDDAISGNPRFLAEGGILFLNLSDVKSVF
jgi:hypothetical protein